MKQINNDFWIIKIPILSTSCPYSGNMISGAFPVAVASELVKDKCYNPSNVGWIIWTYPKCSKETCPMKEI